MCLQGYELNKNVWSLYGVIGICYMISNNKLDKDFFFFFLKGKMLTTLLTFTCLIYPCGSAAVQELLIQKKKKKKMLCLVQFHLLRSSANEL